MSARPVRYPRKLIAYWVAIAFALRALLPQGFMPGSEPFTLKLCPTGLPAQALVIPGDAHAEHHHHHEPQPAPDEHQSHHQRADQCPFGAASASVALLQSLPAPVVWTSGADYSLPLVASDPHPRPAYRPHPRGPPAFS
ncbi:MAG: hypothetical protein ABW034_14360 [Steroidobacteraceae bacterium]